MTKKFLAVSFLSLMLVACGGGNGSGTATGSSGSGTLELSQRDKELANGNPNIAAEILVQKAILQEAKNEKLTEQEQYNLDLAKQEVEVNFYLQKKFDKDFSNVSAVSEEEAKKYLNDKVETVEEAIQGALDIIAEVISDDIKYRKFVKDIIYKSGTI